MGSSKREKKKKKRAPGFHLLSGGNLIWFDQGRDGASEDGANSGGDPQGDQGWDGAWNWDDPQDKMGRSNDQST